MTVGNMIYALVLYNHTVKKIASNALKSPLVTQNFIYRRLYERVMNAKMKSFRTIPPRVMIENTNVCNADCVFCPHSKMQRKTGSMDMALTERIIDQCKESGINYVTIYGFGEPLLDKSFFERIKYAKKKGIERVTTNTNAEFLDEYCAERILESGLDEIYISFDAATLETYKKIRPNLHFNKVEDNIQRLIEIRNRQNKKKPEIYLSFVVSPDNEHEVRQYINKWKTRVDGVSISLMHNWTGSLNRDSGVEHYKKDPCRLLWTDMVISWNGDVPLCCNDYENRIVLGNIKEQTIKDIWGGDKINGIRQHHKNGAFDKVSLCAKCEYNYHHKSPWWIAK